MMTSRAQTFQAMTSIVNPVRRPAPIEPEPQEETEVDELDEEEVIDSGSSEG